MDTVGVTLMYIKAVTYCVRRSLNTYIVMPEAVYVNNKKLPE
jgi:hypothetical protein